MNTRPSSQSLISRARRFLLTMLALLVGAGLLQSSQAQAKWCGPQSVIDACMETILLLTEEQDRQNAALRAAEMANDEVAINSILMQLIALGETIASVQAYVIDWSGPCMVAEVCPTCSLPLSECPGHEALCPVCYVALSQCPGHQEQQCLTCYLPLSQCQGHYEQQCGTCFLPLSQCQGHYEQQCTTCYLPLSQCQGHEQQCTICYQPLSQCQGHYEQQCPTCYLPLSQCYCPLP